MHPDADIGEAYAHCARTIAEWLQRRPPGTVFSIDVGRSALDSIASSATVFTQNEFLAAPSLIRYRSLMLDRSQSLGGTDASLLIGQYDGWLENFRQEGSRPGRERYQTQSIDSWLGGRKPPNLIHFGDTDLLLDHIHGAAKTIEYCRPIVTLYPAAHDRVGLASLLSEFGYTVADLWLRPVRDAGTASPSGFGWIAVPNEKEGASLGKAGAEPRKLEQGASRFAFGEALPRQRRSSSVFGFGVSQAPELAYRLPASEIICRTDCYAFESDGEKSWRWLGPRSHSRIAVPCPLPGSYSLEITAIGASAPERLATCRVLAEGKEMRTSTAQVIEGKLSFIAHSNWTDYAGYLDIEFITFGSKPPTSTDFRTLRLCLESIAVTPCN